MKQITVLLFFLISISFISLAKKDENAWKKEKNLHQQFTVFKSNLSFWNGSYYLSEAQLNQFYNAVIDSVELMEKAVLESKIQVKELQNEINSNTKEIEVIQNKLNESNKHENTISFFGAEVNKSMYTLTMYLLIFAAMAISGSFFILFNRSRKTTKQIKNDYNDLKEEYELHKKNALERYVKMNIELTKTRFELNKK